MAMDADFEKILARSLVTGEKAVRDATVEELKKYAGSRKTFKDLEMMKLWRALYYCVWLSDKVPVQSALCSAVSALMHAFSRQDIAMMYFKCFLRTMFREWSHIDQHRVNKFYVLIRLMLREGLVYLQKQEFAQIPTLEFITVLHDEALSKTPNGIRMHISDIFLEELFEATDGDVSTGSFMATLSPFWHILRHGQDKVFMERVSDRIFDRLLERHADSPNAEESPTNTFADVNLEVMQKELMEIAGDEDTHEVNRKRVYELHKAFSVRVKAIAKNGGPNTSIFKNQQLRDSGKKDKKKAKKKEEAVEGGTDEEEKEKAEKKTQETEPVPVGDKKAKKKSKADKKTENAAAAVEWSMDVEESSNKLSKKEKKEKKAAAAAAAEDEAASSSAATASQPAEEQKDQKAAPKFIASKKWTGSRPCYAYTKGPKGQGYYWDDVQVRRLAKLKKKATNGKNKDKAGVKVAKVGDATSPRKVTFGKNRAKDYLASVSALRSSTPDIRSTPTRPALKRSARK